MAGKTALTWEEFLAAGEEWQRWEYVDGEVEFMSPVNLRHQAILARLITYLVKFCECHPEWLWFPGDATFTMSSGNWRCPDAALVRAERFPGGTIPTEPGRFAPNVAFEIYSSGDTAARIQRKRQDYQASSVIQVWIDPDQRLAELIYPDRPLQYFEQDQPLIIDELPGFVLDLRLLFSV